MNSKQADKARQQLEQFARQCQELRARAEKAEAERDQLREKLSHYEAGLQVEKETCCQLREQNAALEAHLEDIRAALQVPTCRAFKTVDKVSRVVEDSPTVSLARRDAKVAAEHIELWADTIIQAITYAENKHLEDRNFPAISFDMISELTVDMKEDARRIRQQADTTSVDPREIDDDGNVADPEGYE